MSGSCVGETLIKVEPTTVKWEVKLVQKWNLTLPTPHPPPPLPPHYNQTQESILLEITNKYNKYGLSICFCCYWSQMNMRALFLSPSNRDVPRDSWQLKLIHYLVVKPWHRWRFVLNGQYHILFTLKSSFRSRTFYLHLSTSTSKATPMNVFFRI